MQCSPDLAEVHPTSANQPDQITVDSPLQIKLINFLGLKNYLMQKLIFKPKPSTYQIRSEHGRTKLFLPKQYKPPVRYEMQVGILECQSHSIPFVKLIPRNKKIECYDTIVYAHGNSSDMSDGLRFMEKMALIYEAQYLIFDYNGYGESKNSEVGQDIISKDIEILLAWLNKPLNQVILWGFSLGTFPVLSAAAKYPVKGVILQCPIASVACFFQENLFPDIKFKQDYFSNLNLITSVKAKILMIHSHSDEVIPIKHVQLMFDKFVSVNGGQNIFFIEVMKLSHNGIHKYIISQKPNDLQKELLSFLDNLKPNQLLESPQIQEIDPKLSKLKDKIKLSKIEQNCFEEQSYEIVEGLNGYVGVKSKIAKTNCFCFSTEMFYQNSRDKFRSK